MSIPERSRRPIPRPLLACAGALVGVALIAQVTAPEGGAPDPQVVRVVSTELVCPDAQAGDRTSTLLSAVTPQPIVAGTAGRAVIGTSTDRDSLGVLEGARSGLDRTTPEGTEAVVGTAVAQRAPGFTMDQLTSSTGTDQYGLAGTPCGEAVSDAWFAGSVSDVGRFPRLFLVNPESTPATVDIALYGPQGRIDAPAGLGLRVRGDDRRTVRLDRLAPGAGALVVRVVATSGRVGAGLFDAQVDGLVPMGSDWIPASAAPATRAVVPGIGSGQSRRSLVVFAPGEGTATVRVSLVGLEGRFSPSGAATFEVDRGRVSVVDLGAAAASDQTAAVVESDVPLLATVRWTLQTGDTDELAFAAAAPALTGPAVVSGNRVTDGWGTALFLTAVDGAATVTVQPLVAGVAKGKPVTIKVPAGHTVRPGLPSNGASGWYAAVVTPAEGSGPVHAAVMRTRRVGTSAGVTVSPLRDARIEVAVPEAWSNPEVGLGR